MRFLAENGWSAVTLSQALPLLWSDADSGAGTAVGKGSEGTVVVTFDDGFRDFYSEAHPVMRDHGFRATVFLATGFIGGKFKGERECLAASEIRELLGDGVEFGSHTVTHPQLRELTLAQAQAELVTSKNTIEEMLGKNVELFSYPYRFPEEDRDFTKHLRHLLLEVGYRAGVTTSIGLSRPNQNPMFLRRLPINECDDDSLLAAKLRGDYDWLHIPQLALKTVRGWRHGRGSMPG